MSRISYTPEQLYRLRESPLVKKPEGLPSIEQWVEVTQEAAQRKPRTQTNGRPEETSGAMGSFGTHRPTLLQTRQTRVSNGGEITLGPPKTAFASARSIKKGADGDGTQEMQSSSGALPARTRNTNEEGLARHTGQDDDREGWMTARNGRNNDSKTGYGDGERFSRGGRDVADRTRQGDDAFARRGNMERKTEQRWSRDGDDKRASKLTGREGGWRDRERRQDNRDREAVEKEPEWMDGPADYEEPAAKTAAEFEKWKARMRGQNVEDTPPPPPDFFQLEQTAAAAKPAPSVLSDSVFGTWGDKAKTDLKSPQTEVPPAKAAAAKKASRFASMFAPKEEPQIVEAAPEPLAFLQSEDQQGFERMLMKLRAKNSQSQEPHTPGTPLHSLLSPGVPAGHPEGRPGSNPSAGFDALAAFGPPSSASGPPSRHLRAGSRGDGLSKAATPETQHASPLPGGQRQQKGPAALSKDSEFLLNLIQMKSASRPAQQPPPQPEHDPGFQLFLDQPPRQAPQGADRGRPPPGVPNMHGNGVDGAFSPNLTRAGPDVPQDRPPIMPRPPPGFMEAGQRPPPGYGMPEGFFPSYEDPRYRQQQQQHHLPQQQPPPYGPGQEAGPIPPPPGFMRGPPQPPSNMPPPHMFPQQLQQHGGPPPLPQQQQQSGGPNGIPIQLMHHHIREQQQQQQQQQQQRGGPPGLSLEHGFPPLQSGLGPGGPGGIAPPPGFAGGPPGFPAGFGAGPRPGGGAGLMSGLNIAPPPGPQQLGQGQSQGQGQGQQGLRSPIEGGAMPFGRGPR